MLSHFPLKRPVFEHQFGISALPAATPMVRADEHFETETAIRDRLLHSPWKDDYLSEPANLTSHSLAALYGLLAQRSDLILETPVGFEHALSGESLDADQLTLQWLGRHLQEDVVLLADTPEAGCPVIGGCVCFPSGWSLREKLGRSLIDVHESVPGYLQQLHPATDKLFRRLKLGKTVWRTNWGVRPWNQLDQSPRHAEPLRQRQQAITADNADCECYFRVEFQTVTRLNKFFVFTIRTEQCPLRELSVQQRRILHGVLQTCPEPVLRYKGIWPLRKALAECLADHQDR